MIIRELVTSFGIDFDGRGAREAESAVSRLNNVLNKLGLAFGAYQAYDMFGGWLEAASSVEEELNVVTQTFGEASDGVLEWAKANADAMSRSEYDLRKYAGQLGAVLAPMLGTKEAAAEMSESLAGLAVDLASFFNKGDEETMERLRSGILGSTEAVDQLGINLRQEHVLAVMAAEGIKKNWKELSEAEKVQYRYLTIMKDTIDKQGDAARTADGYANSVKAAEANVQLIRVALGQKLMPVVKETMQLFGGFSEGMLEIVQHSNAFEVALLGMAAAGAIVAGSFIIANVGALMFGAGIVAVLAVTEDLYTSLEGGEGYFADFFEWMLGEDKWNKVIEYWKFATTKLGDLIWEIFHPEEMEKRYGKAWTTNANTASGQFKHDFGGMAYSQDERDMRTPGIDHRRTPVSQRSGWAEQYFTSTDALPDDPRYRDPGARGGYYGPVLFDNHQSRDERLAASRLNALGSEADISGVAGPMQSLANSVGSLSGAVSGISSMNAGVPMSLPGDTNVTNQVTNYNGGDVNMSVGEGATPDTVREAKRAARELVEDQNRSLKGSASTRG